MSVALTYQGQALIAWPGSEVCMTCGLKPDIALLRCTKEAYENMDGSSAGELTLAQTGHDPIRLVNRWLIKATQIENELYEILVADSRIFWSNTSLSSDYNMYDPILGENTDHGYSIAGTEDTYGDIISDCSGAVSDTISAGAGVAITNAPRNLVGKGRSIVEVLSIILHELGATITPSKDGVNYGVVPAGANTALNKTTQQWCESHKIAGGEVYINPLIRPAVVRTVFGAAYRPGDKFRYLVDGTSATAGQNVKVLEERRAARFVNGSAANETKLAEVSVARASAYVNAREGTWRDILFANWMYPGLLGEDFHRLEWRYSELGCTTRGISYCALDEIQPTEQPSNLFAADGFPLRLVGFWGEITSEASGGGGWYAVKRIERDAVTDYSPSETWADNEAKEVNGTESISTGTLVWCEYAPSGEVRFEYKGDWQLTVAGENASGSPTSITPVDKITFEDDDTWIQNLVAQDGPAENDDVTVTTSHIGPVDGDSEGTRAPRVKSLDGLSLSSGTLYLDYTTVNADFDSKGHFAGDQDESSSSPLTEDLSSLTGIISSSSGSKSYGTWRRKADGAHTETLSELDYRACVFEAEFYWDDGSDSKAAAESVDGIWIDDDLSAATTVLAATIDGVTWTLQVAVDGDLELVSSGPSNGEHGIVLVVEIRHAGAEVTVP